MGSKERSRKKSLKTKTSASSFVGQALAEALKEDFVVDCVFAGVVFAFYCCVSFEASYVVSFEACFDVGFGSSFVSNFDSNSDSSFDEF